MPGIVETGKQDQTYADKIGSFLNYCNRSRFDMKYVDIDMHVYLPGFWEIWSKLAFLFVLLWPFLNAGNMITLSDASDHL